MGLDGAVGGGVSHAGQHEAGFDLVVVEEALVRLVDGAGGELAGAGGAGASAAGVRQVDALLLGGIKDVLIVGNLDGLVESLALVDEGDLVGSHGKDWGSQTPECSGPVGPHRPTSDRGAAGAPGSAAPEAQSKGGHA